MKNNIPSSGQSNEVSKPSGDTTQSTIDQIVKALAYKTDILGSTIPSAQVILSNPEIQSGTAGNLSKILFSVATLTKIVL